MATCYRHPSRETGVSCSNCGRPICPDCMTPTPVGMRCPECAKQKTKVRTASTMYSEPRVTYALIGLCVIAFLTTGNFGATGTGASRLYSDGALFGPAIALNDEYWRLVTSGFLHAGLLHIGFNMYLLYLLGTQLEPTMGSVRFGVLYLTALLVGSLGALLQTTGGTVGASGAVFGLMGAMAMEMRARGIDPLRSDIGVLIGFNLLLGFVLPNVSWGGHIGGLVGGALAALAFQQAGRLRQPWIGYVACAVLAAGAVAGSIAVSEADVRNLTGF